MKNSWKWRTDSPSLGPLLFFGLREFFSGVPSLFFPANDAHSTARRDGLRVDERRVLRITVSG